MSRDAVVLLLDAALRVTVVVAGGWTLTTLMRRNSASARHFAWMCTIVAAAAMPVAAVVMPDWNVSWVSRLAVAVAPGAEATGRNVDLMNAGTGERSAAAAVQPSGTARSGGMAPSTVLLAIWLTGAIGVAGYVGAGVLAARRLRRRAAIAGGSWADEARALASSLGVRGSITFVESADVEVPMVCGLWRAALVVPRAASEWPHERLHVALLHELAHVRRRDCLTQAFAQAICALHWFNPLMWVAARRLRDERERACDDFVLEAGVRRSAYAAHLLEIGRGMGSRIPAGAHAGVSMTHRSQLEERLMAILNPEIPRSTRLSTRLGAAAAILVVALPVAAVQLRDARDPASDAPPADVVSLQSPRSQHAIPLQGEVKKLVIRPESLEQRGPWGADERLVFPSERTGDLTEQRPARAIDRALVESAAEGDLQGVKDLLAAGANVDAVHVSGHAGGSALIAAAREGRLEIARLLLDRGADPNMRAPHHDNPIVAAALGGNAAVVELLLQRGAYVDQVADGNESALMRVSGSGRLEMVKLLVSRGADVNKRIWVDWFEHQVTIDKESGVVAIVSDPPSGEWRSPLSVARRGEHPSVVKYLIGAGAQD